MMGAFGGNVGKATRLLSPAAMAVHAITKKDKPKASTGAVAAAQTGG
jgi:hypothetical protein